LELDNLFFWFCKNKAEIAPEDLSRAVWKVNNEPEKAKVESPDCFFDFILESWKTILTVKVGINEPLAIFKWHQFYFLDANDIETSGPHDLDFVVSCYYILREREEIEGGIELLFDPTEIPWIRIQEIMTAMYPKNKKVIIVNSKNYYQKSNGLWEEKL
tara:strand:- start:31 stop:507 length:477 start_codon:yes stop_codon:yes gene_type:complete